MGFSIARTLAAGEHLGPDTLGLYVLGDLSVDTAAAVEEHLAWCARCNNELPNVKAVIAALRA
jgi:anti-sigma factor RsiW